MKVTEAKTTAERIAFYCYYMLALELDTKAFIARMSARSTQS